MNENTITRFGQRTNAVTDLSLPSLIGWRRTDGFGDETTRYLQEHQMKLRVIYLTGALIATALPLSARVIPVQPDPRTANTAQQAMSARYTCPPGYYWDPDGYAPHGKFRPAHCAVRW